MRLDERQMAKFDAVCARIAEQRSVKEVCLAKDSPISKATFFRWLEREDVILSYRVALVASLAMGDFVRRVSGSNA